MSGQCRRVVVVTLPMALTSSAE
jgi:hypothetical protein